MQLEMQKNIHILTIPTVPLLHDLPCFLLNEQLDPILNSTTITFLPYFHYLQQGHNYSKRMFPKRKDIRRCGSSWEQYQSIAIKGYSVKTVDSSQGMIDV
jgi:hypothetical protein